MRGNRCEYWEVCKPHSLKEHLNALEKVCGVHYVKKQDKIFKDIIDLIKCVSRHLHKFEWTCVFRFASKIDTNKKHNVNKGLSSVLRVDLRDYYFNVNFFLNFVNVNGLL